MMTLKELKGLTEKASKTRVGKTPKANALLQSDIPVIVKEVINENCEIMVFANGYVCYRADDHTTVFPLHEVDFYEYKSVEKSSVLEGDFFENENWYVRLILEGEDRIAKNEEKYHRNFSSSYSDLAEDCSFMKDQTQDTLENLMIQELLNEVFEYMDDRAVEAFIANQEMGITHAEIAEMIQMKPNAVTKLIKRNLEKVRNMMCMEDGELIFKVQK